eukprot:11617006-Ditylum_brightwellii.AAC.2
MLPCLKPSGIKMTIAKINKYVISKNVPGKMTVAYISQGGNRLAKSDEIKEKLEELEEAHELEKKISAGKENKWPIFQKNNSIKKGNSNTKKKDQTGSTADKRGGGPKKASDKQHLPGHDHNWVKCKNNTKSDNYKGTHYKDM